MSCFFEEVKKIKEHTKKIIITQCKVGGRSLQAQRQLEIMGFEKVINLAGGISKYKGKTI